MSLVNLKFADKKLYTSFFLIIFIFYINIISFINYEQIAYYGFAGLKGRLLLSGIYILVLIGLFLGRSRPIIQTTPIKKSILLEISFYILPLLLLTIINIISISTYQINKPLDIQPYLNYINLIKGKVIIHLLPAGIVYKLCKSKFSKIELIFLCTSILTYSIMYSERAYSIPFLGILILELTRRNLFNLKSLIKTFSIILIFFILVELTRSFLFIRLLSGEMNILEAINSAILRIFTYYADTFYKSSHCLEKGVSSLINMCSSANLDWFTNKLTNRGLFSIIYPTVPYPLICLIAFIFSFISSKLMLSYEQSNTNNWDKLLTPYLFTVILESPRWQYILQLRFLIIIPAIVYLYLIVRSISKR